MNTDLAIFYVLEEEETPSDCWYLWQGGAGAVPGYDSPDGGGLTPPLPHKAPHHRPPLPPRQGRDFVLFNFFQPYKNALLWIQIH